MRRAKEPRAAACSMQAASARVGGAMCSRAAVAAGRVAPRARRLALGGGGRSEGSTPRRAISRTARASRVRCSREAASR